MKDIELRIATIDDLDAIVKVGEGLFDLPVKPNRASEFLSDPRHHLCIALDGSNVVGMVSAFDYVHPDKDPVLFIDEAGVIDSHQGKGIGKNMIKYMCNHAKSLQCKEAWILTDQANTAARRTYLGAGGRESSEKVVLFDFNL